MKTSRGSSVCLGHGLAHCTLGIYLWSKSVNSFQIYQLVEDNFLKVICGFLVKLLMENVDVFVCNAQACNNGLLETQISDDVSVFGYRMFFFDRYFPVHRNIIQIPMLRVW